MDIVRITHLPDHPRAVDRPSRRTLSAHLNAEWDALVRDPAVQAELADAPIAGHDDLVALLAACGGDQSLPMELADATLAQVVAAGLEGRHLARRLVLQRVLGALVRIATRRTRSCPARRQSLFDDLCSTAWIIIGSYPLLRRPRAIAVNISRDAEYLTCVRPERLHDAWRCGPLLEEHEPTVDLWGRPERHPRDELGTLLHDLSDATALVTSERTLLRALADGASTAAIATAFGCTDRTVRNRRERLLGRLRELATEPVG